MERAEFHPYLVYIHFMSIGGQCECEGCLFTHYGRCSEKFDFADRTTSDSEFGWQADHKWGAWTNHSGNLRILCVDCHKRTASYGRKDPTRGLRALSSMGLPTPIGTPPPRQSLASVYNPPAQNLFAAVSTPAPKTDWLSALLAPKPPPQSLSEMIASIMGSQKIKP